MGHKPLGRRNGKHAKPTRTPSPFCMLDEADSDSDPGAETGAEAEAEAAAQAAVVAANGSSVLRPKS